MNNLIRSAKLSDHPRVLQLRKNLGEFCPPAEIVDSGHLDTLPSPNMQVVAIPATQNISEDEPCVAPTAEPERIQQLDTATELRLLEEARNAREAAIIEGRALGYEQGLTEAKQALSKELKSVAGLLESVSEAMHTQISGLEDIVVALAFDAVCKIVADSQSNRDGIAAVVREALKHAKDSEGIVVRVAPFDYAQLTKYREDWANGRLGQSISLVADDRVVLGGCLVETAGGSLDARLETQFQQFKEALLSAKRQRPDWTEESSDI